MIGQFLSQSHSYDTIHSFERAVIEDAPHVIVRIIVCTIIDGSADPAQRRSGSAHSHTCLQLKMYTIYTNQISLRLPMQAIKQHFEVSKGAKIRNRYKQVPHLTQDTNGKVTNSPLDTTNESQEVSPFPAGNHKANINRRAQRHCKHKTEKT